MTFCRTHDFPFDPTTDTLSFYVVYICHFIKPKSVSSYLSGICNQLEVFYPDVRQNCTHPIVKRTLQGCKKIHISIASRKWPLQHTELTKVFDKLHSSPSFDDQLFLLVFPDKNVLQDFRKVIMRLSFLANDNHIEFNLPTHKADRAFRGNQIVFKVTSDRDDTVKIARNYVRQCDSHFPGLPHLWVRSDGSVPTRSWFIRRLRSHFSDNVAGHPLRSGGATWLASLAVQGTAAVIRAIPVFT
ncbi:hypothetical protein EV359DRAFT_74626 [Lentinula novae-zelandiae]|nr:hypothetical protein EV359DRAFT_74626 [Lentinula novae-zelandiae]